MGGMNDLADPTVVLPRLPGFTKDLEALKDCLGQTMWLPSSNGGQMILPTWLQISLSALTSLLARTWRLKLPLIPTPSFEP